MSLALFLDDNEVKFKTAVGFMFEIQGYHFQVEMFHPDQIDVVVYPSNNNPFVLRFQNQESLIEYLTKSFF